MVSLSIMAIISEVMSCRGVVLLSNCAGGGGGGGGGAGGFMITGPLALLRSVAKPQVTMYGTAWRRKTMTETAIRLMKGIVRCRRLNAIRRIVGPLFLRTPFSIGAVVSKLVLRVPGVKIGPVVGPVVQAILGAFRHPALGVHPVGFVAPRGFRFNAPTPLGPQAFHSLLVLRCLP